MEKIYGSPFRVYLFFGLMLGLGIYSYWKIPVALFPNSTKPQVGVHVPYGKLTRDSFINDYGKDLEATLKGVQTKTCTAEETRATYGSTEVDYKTTFRWGDDGDLCVKEITQILSTYKSKWPEDVQNKSYAYLSTRGTGFLFANFHSDIRSSEQIYELIEPILQPKLAAIREANNPQIFNPSQTEVSIELSPLKMASFKLLPKDIILKIKDRLQNFGGGVLRQNGNNLSIEISSNIDTLEELSKIMVSSDPKKMVFLSEVAQIRLDPSSQNRRILKVNGTTAVSIWVTPAPGKNIKVMSEKAIAAAHETLESPNIPKDIKFDVAINPAEFINDAISNVMGEVWLCSLIAVLVLFLFIGSFVGTLTALIEIPMSIILSFIIMKMTNVQLNLISLGGLALSVGMNVDASIVVIDSIIKRFAANPLKSFGKTSVVTQVSDAVREVAAPVIVSTITSLIVFIPLVFTSDLSYAILGDLAKAVIYSHALSLFIAMILVPTVRIHIAQASGHFSEKHSIGFLDKSLEGVYNGYCKYLELFLNKTSLKNATYALVLMSLVLVCLFIPPQLKREIIAKPESPIVFVEIESSTNVHIDQMEELVSKFERRISEKFGRLIAFTEASIYSASNAWVALHLQDKKKFRSILESAQEMTKEDTEARYYYSPFNPSELPIPNPPDWKVAFRGSNIAQQEALKEEFRIALLESNVVEDVQENNDGIFDNKLLIQLHEEKLDLLNSGSLRVQPSDLAQIVSLSTEPIFIGYIALNQKVKQIFLKYPAELVNSASKVGSLPIPIGEKIIPLRALGDFKSMKEPPELVRINGENVFTLSGFLIEKEKKEEKKILKEFSNFVKQFGEKIQTGQSPATVDQVDAKVELSKALSELLLAIAISIALIFLVIFIQFSSVVHSLIIMLAIPFGILGVFVSLWVFNSTLSLNSGLGVILLVGITVANSIMLVEMIVRLVESGVAIKDAIMETARKRIRPIIMTSLTTILGMFPIALGHGDGGTVLQPLGIAVCGGLWVSLIFTLFIIPALELSYLTWLQKSKMVSR